MSTSPHVRATKKTFSKSQVFKFETFKRIIATQPPNKIQIIAKDNEFDEVSPRKKSSFDENFENLHRKYEEDVRNEEISLEIIEKFINSQRNLIKKVIFL